jgi:FkbM family methyltransferase
MTILSSLRRAAERLLDVNIVRRGSEYRIVAAELLPLMFEKEHLRKFFDYFNVDCVFDVGANAGQYAKRLREEIGYYGSIISYEPIPELAQQIRTAARNDSAWFVEEMALGKVEGASSFNVFAESEFSSLHELSTAIDVEQIRNAMATPHHIEVQIGILAKEINKYRARLGFKRPFLKMDTQGHDLDVAMGAGDHLREFVGLQSELAIKRVYANSPTYEECLAYYHSRGFELSAFVPNNLGFFPRLIEIDCILYRA